MNAFPEGNIPKIKDVVITSPIYVWDNFWFTKVSDELYEKAENIASKISNIARGKKTVLLSDKSDIIGKVGEYSIRCFCEQNLSCPWVSYVEEINTHGGDRFDLEIDNRFQVDVKTRQLHGDVTVAPNFDLRVLESELRKFQHFYILAGYCPESSYSYAFGWCSWDELQSQPIKMDIRVPAKCLPLMELHPMEYFEDFILSNPRI